MWSLATEVQFYVVLPLLFLRVGKRSRVPVGVPILAVFALAYVLFVAGLFGLGSRVVAQSIVGRGPVFLCGMAAAWVYARYGTRLRAWRPLAVGGDLALVASLVALEALLRVIAPTAREWEIAPYAAWHVPEGMLWALVLLLVVIDPLRLRGVFVNPVLMRFGVISYSIYLLHWPFLYWAGKLVHSPLVLATGGTARPGTYFLAAVSVPLAAVTYRFVERPFLVRKARVGEKPQAAETLPTARRGVSGRIPAAI